MHQVVLTAPGVHYLGCAGKTVSGVSHCQLGQRFTVTVHGSESRRQLQVLTPGPNASVTPSPPIAPAAFESPSGSNNTTAIAGVSTDPALSIFDKLIC